MKKQLPLGLVLEGSSSRSAILRLPNIADDLGPIKCSSMRLARRFSNLMQGGYAVADYEELQNAQAILLRVPDAAVGRIVEQLCASELVLDRLSVVLCDTWLSTDALAPLCQRGASVATLTRLASTERNWFVVEGQVRASRVMRRFIEKHEGRAFDMKAGCKYLLFAAELFASILPIPLLLAAQASFRHGGVTGNEVAAVIDQMAGKAVREVIKGIRMPLNALPMDCSSEVGARYMHALQEREPALATFIREEQNASAKLINEVWKNAIDGGSDSAR
jgi:hypothetical protein